jgi:hypothetical protein
MAGHNWNRPICHAWAKSMKRNGSLHVVCPSQGSLRGALKPHGSKTPPYSERPISAAGKARIGAAARPCVRKVGLRRASKHHSQCDKSYLLAVIWSRIPSPRDMWARYRQLKAAGLPTGRAKKPAATPRRRTTLIDDHRSQLYRRCGFAAQPRLSGISPRTLYLFACRRTNNMIRPRP